MNFGLTPEQEMVVATVRSFVEHELYPLEAEVERTGEVPAEIGREITRKVQELGFYAPNIPEEFGGGGLDHLTFTLLERELGRASYALSVFWGRPSNILCGCNEEQRQRYLLPAARGERIDCLAMTEPEAGSDVRSMKTTARRDGGDWVIDGTKHFISHADLADFAIVFVATGSEETRAGPKQRITCFLVDRGTPGFEIRPGYRSVSHRGYHNCILNFDGCRVPDAQILGEEGQGFELMNIWLYATRLTVAAMSVGRARRAFDLAAEWAASRRQFGQPIGKFQGTSFKLADMATEIDAADLLTLNAAWLLDRGQDANRMIAQAKLYATEMLARVTDHAIQIFGGMGLMEETGVERFWRDARVERIWDGTSEIQRHIISRDILRKLEAEVDLRRLLQPRSIAVFGGRQAEGVIRRCAEMGFSGPIWPVHPSKAEVGGRRTYRGVADLPEAPDAAFVAVNREATVGIVRELAAIGAGGAVCHAAGFKESGGRGTLLQAALIEAAGDMPFLGPNCYGAINYLDGALLWFDQHGGRRCERGVAILTQSGNIGLNLTMQRRSLPIGHLLTLGNQAKVGLSDCIAALVDDPRVTAIGLHIEAIDDVAAFDAAARKALAARQPVVAVKAGRSEAGVALALSHTASLAGTDAAMDALLRRVGVARVASIPILLETLKLLHTVGPLPGRDLVTLSCSGGEAALIADAGDGRRVRFRPFEPAQAEAVRATLSDLVTISNPLDYHIFIWGQPERLRATFTAVMACGWALACLVLDLPREDSCSDADWQISLDAWEAARNATGGRAGVLATLPECLPEPVARRLIASGIAPLAGIDEAIAACEAAADIGAAQAAEAPMPLLLTSEPMGEAVTLDEWRGKQLLAGFGLAHPGGRLVATPAEAVRAAGALGYPVVVKAAGTALAHKSELGAVALDLRDAAAVEAAASRMAQLGEAILVEPMIADGVAELILGVIRDPQIGLCLVIGSGGVLVELLADRALLLLPTTGAEVRAAVLGLKGAPLLTGFRGRPAGDIAAVVAAALAVARFAIEHAHCLVELDVNPLIVRPAGLGAVAADVLIRLVSEGQGS